MQMEQNRLAHKRNLVEIDYKVKALGRKIEEEKVLWQNKSIPKRQFEDTKDELEYYTNLKIITLESQSTDMNMQDQQIKFLEQSYAQLESNMFIYRKNINNLMLKAPVDGTLSDFIVEVGQSIEAGGRLGQIDDTENFKISAGIDEFYLGRAEVGQTAKFELDGKEYNLRVSKIYPKVENGQFVVDLAFDDNQPQGIRRGQSIQAKLTLGDANKALLLPLGTFFHDTGGNWIFVVSNDAKEAVRRNITLGRRNTKYVEVLEGLTVGESVVTSAYTAFTEMERLTINAK